MNLQLHNIKFGISWIDILLIALAVVAVYLALKKLNH